MKKFYFLFLLVPIFFFSCQKKGNVDVKNFGFWANNCTPPYEVQFYLDVAYQPKEITYTWDFGDGQTSFEKEPVHQFQEPGKYTVKVTIVNYKTTVEKSLVVDVSQNPMPVIADFEYETTGNNYYAPCEIMFYNNSQYATNYFWNFGDGHGSTDVQPTHIYEEPGTYDVYLHSICNDDTVASLFQMEILPPPTKIYVDVVSVWLPYEFIGGLFELEYGTDIHNETPFDLGDISPDDFPMSWFINEDLFFFDGDYNSEQLSFIINDKLNADQTIYSFSTRFEEIQADGYPDTLYWDGGSGFAAEVLLSYGE